MGKSLDKDFVDYLRTTTAIRERCGQIYHAGLGDHLAHFQIRPERIPSVVDYVTTVIKESYPNLDIPYHSRWRHFDAGEVDRVGQFIGSHQKLSTAELGRIKFELVITSVLLDAGAGRIWRFLEPGTNQVFTRSEGLAIASLYAYRDGVFSSKKDNKLLADGDGLINFNDECLNRAFQVTLANPMVGNSGRANLIRSLGKIVNASPHFFSRNGEVRLGNLFNYLCEQSSNGTLSALRILKTVLEAFQSIWPSRISIAGENLGDVWEHPAIVGSTADDHYVPFHKLSQWLTYSLIEPLESSGLAIHDIDRLTVVPEYRNGGLLIDSDVLVPKSKNFFTHQWNPGDEAIVEWRALTVHILDMLGEGIAAKIGQTPQQFPLAKALQGGTWSAGRKIALKKRPDGSPPVTIISDGTVF